MRSETKIAIDKMNQLPLPKRLEIFENYMYAKHNYGMASEGGTDTGEFWDMGVTTFIRKKWPLYETKINKTIPRESSNYKQIRKFASGINCATKEWKWFIKQSPKTIHTMIKKLT